MISAKAYDIAETTRKIKDELRIFSNFSAILEKAENDGYIKILSESVREVFQQEIDFAIKGKLIRAEEAQGEEEEELQPEKPP